MKELDQKRQLAAIMFTDIVGYTILMGEDEDRAFSLLRKNRDLHKVLIADFHGKFLKEMGDGILASFPTISDAVQCSLAIQKKVAEENNYTLRIGLHSGEVLIENDDIFGDGVNIASRIADHAKPGHILVSDTVYRDLGNKKNVKGKLLNKINLKNVKESINIYWIRDEADNGESTPDSKNDSSLYAEIVRRNIPNSILAYSLISLIIIQVSRLLFPFFTSFGWPLITLLAIILTGLPILIYLAWNYERSPSGIIKISKTDSSSNPYTPERKKPLTGIKSLITLAILMVLSFLVPMPERGIAENIRAGFMNLSSSNEELSFTSLEQLTYSERLAVTPAWSPDGKSIAYSSNELGDADIWITSVDGSKRLRLTNSNHSDKNPSWAPNGESIIFERSGYTQGIYQIDAQGGRPAKILPYGSQPSWSSNGAKIVFSWQGRIFTYSNITGSVDTVVNQIGNPPFARWLPDNENIIYWNSVSGKLMIVSSTTGKKRDLDIIPSGENINGLSVSSDGTRIIYSKGAFGGNNSLWQVSINKNSFKPTSDAIAIRLSITNDIECALSPDNSMIAFTSKNIIRHLFQIPRDSVTGLRRGSREQLTTKGKLNYYPAMQAGGGKIILTSHMGGKGFLYSLNLETKKITKVTNEYGKSTREVEASVGQGGYPIYFSSTVGGDSYNLYKQEMEDGFPIRLNHPNPNANLVAPAISPDGTQLVYYFTDSNDGDNFDLALKGVNLSESATKLTNYQSNEMLPVWSPDGEQIAYLSDHNGSYKIWKMNKDGSDQHEVKNLPAFEHGWCDWSPDGKWFYYSANNGYIFNIYRIGKDSTAIPFTTFQLSEFGLPENKFYTKFEVTMDKVILPLEKRDGEIYLLSY